VIGGTLDGMMSLRNCCDCGGQSAERRAVIGGTLDGMMSLRNDVVLYKLLFILIDVHMH